MSESNNSSSHTVGFKAPPKHSQFKKGRSGNPRGRPKKYNAAAERKQLRALLELLATRTDYGVTGKGNPQSMSYILWLIKELEIQIRLQVYDRVKDSRPTKKRQKSAAIKEKPLAEGTSIT